MVGNLEDDSFPFEMVPFGGNIRSFSGGGGTVIGIHNESPTLELTIWVRDLSSAEAKEEA